MDDPTTGPTATAELAHEALIRCWSRFAGWVDSDAGFQRWLVTMEDRAAEKELLPEARISEAERWLAERPDDIPTEVHKLIGDSKNLLLQRIAELEDARSRAEDSPPSRGRSPSGRGGGPLQDPPSAPVHRCLDRVAGSRRRRLPVCVPATGHRPKRTRHRYL
jgi:hypothetical protein